MKCANFVFFLAIVTVCQCTYAQSEIIRSPLQDSLGILSSRIWKQKTDTGKLAANEIFLNTFRSALESDSNALFAFDSIHGITKIAAENGKLQIFSWNVPLSQGNNKYFGFIRLSVNPLVILQLRSNNNEVAGLSEKQLDTESWYGCIYYSLIETGEGDKKEYTLLGWDGFTSESNRKIIDIIRFDPSGKVTFGKPIFKTEKGIRSRIIYEFSEKANMLLRYDYQTILIEKRKKIKRVNSWLIVMDRLIPMDPSMEGFRKFYVPAGDAYDGFIFKDGYWVFVENIEVSNKVNKKN